MLCGVICLSHSPLMHHNRAPGDVEARWNGAIAEARRYLVDVEADLCLVFFPDHLNGFLYNLLPPFCVGAAGQSLGDFGTVPGPINIPEAIAADCHAFCVARSIDAAISYDMLVDHGGTQPFEMLADIDRMSGFVPLLINCIAPPMPSFTRAREIGRIVGDWAAQRRERIVIIGSGGLSHDPPLPSIETAQGIVAERLRKGGLLYYRDRIARQHRVLAEGKSVRSGGSKVRPLNPEWDRATITDLAAGKLDLFDQLSTKEISDAAGNGAHELRTWVAALSAMDAVGGFEAPLVFYEAVDEWITGMGLLVAKPKADRPKTSPQSA
ncbi:MAG: 3-carboxyethylcatechol 2,3-dioxygenase [Sphingomonadaceae bacterium]